MTSEPVVANAPISAPDTGRFRVREGRYDRLIVAFPAKVSCSSANRALCHFVRGQISRLNCRQVQVLVSPFVRRSQNRTLFRFLPQTGCSSPEIIPSPQRAEQMFRDSNRVSL
jgi:hypothetical protein